MSEPHPLPSVTGMAWPVIPGPAVSAMLALQWQLDRSQWLSPEEVRRAQFGQLAELLRHAVRQVPKYRGLDPGAFAAWPPLAADDARANDPDLFAVEYPKEHGRLLETRTTGSTGKPFRVFHTEASQFFGHGMVIRDHLLHQRDLSAKLASTLASVTRGAHAGWGLMNGVFHTGPAVTLNTSEGLDAQLDWLIEEAPTYVAGHAGNLYELVRHSRRRGRAPSSVRQLLTRGGILPPDLHDLARDLWKAEVADTYSCEEFGLLASQCPGTNHYHVHAEHVLVEVVRDDGAPCLAGETGRVLVTTLQNFAMPLVRYELGDYAEAGEPCRCGRGLPVLRRIVGRSRNMLRTPDGRTSFPALPPRLWNDVPIRQYRLVQSSLERIEVHYAMDRWMTPYEQALVTALLRDAFAYPFAIAFLKVDAFERGPGGKYEDFISLIQDRV